MSSKKCDNNLIKTDIKNETIKDTMGDLQSQIKLLKRQNMDILLKMENEVLF